MSMEFMKYRFRFIYSIQKSSQKDTSVLIKEYLKKMKINPKEQNNTQI